mmetsp:Transcript_49444/g.148991  ORF Transcript_49444/g.148991 Transcript_49444/m.148991 type:complete len:489 (+) Transcript_49444:1716-3182(+)
MYIRRARSGIAPRASSLSRIPSNTRRHNSEVCASKSSTARRRTRRNSDVNSCGVGGGGGGGGRRALEVLFGLRGGSSPSADAWSTGGKLGAWRRLRLPFPGLRGGKLGADRRTMARGESGALPPRSTPPLPGVPASLPLPSRRRPSRDSSKLPAWSRNLPGLQSLLSKIAAGADGRSPSSLPLGGPRPRDGGSSGARWAPPWTLLLPSPINANPSSVEEAVLATVRGVNVQGVSVPKVSTSLTLTAALGASSGIGVLSPRFSVIVTAAAATASPPAITPPTASTSGSSWRSSFASSPSAPSASTWASLGGLSGSGSETASSGAAGKSSPLWHKPSPSPSSSSSNSKNPPLELVGGSGLPRPALLGWAGAAISVASPTATYFSSSSSWYSSSADWKERTPGGATTGPTPPSSSAAAPWPSSSSPSLSPSSLPSPFSSVAASLDRDAERDFLYCGGESRFETIIEAAAASLVDAAEDGLSALLGLPCGLF